LEISAAAAQSIDAESLGFALNGLFGDWNRLVTDAFLLILSKQQQLADAALLCHSIPFSEHFFCCCTLASRLSLKSFSKASNCPFIHRITSRRNSKAIHLRVSTVNCFLN